MTATTKDHLIHCETRTENGDRLQVRHAERLIRLGHRADAIFAALRGDPGHDVTRAVVPPTHGRTKAVELWGKMGRALLAHTGPFERGVCRVCGCTELTPCIDGRPWITESNAPHPRPVSQVCYWVPETERTLCSAPDCVEAALESGMIAPPCVVCRQFGCSGHPIPRHDPVAAPLCGC